MDRANFWHAPPPSRPPPLKRRPGQRNQPRHPSATITATTILLATITILSATITTNTSTTITTTTIITARPPSPPPSRPAPTFQREAKISLRVSSQYFIAVSSICVCIHEHDSTLFGLLPITNPLLLKCKPMLLGLQLSLFR